MNVQEIRNLINNGHLNLSRRGLSLVPPAIWELGGKELRSINLSGNPQINAFEGKMRNLSRVTHLDLSGTGIVSLPNDFCELKSLTELKLDNCKIAEFPRILGSMIQIEHLSIGGNKLASLPPEIGGMTGLQYLKLSENPMTSLPSEIGALVNLRELDMDSMELTGLPDEMESLTNLETVWLGRNNFTHYPLALALAPSLKRADMTMNIGSIPSDVSALRIGRPNPIIVVGPATASLKTVAAAFADGNAVVLRDQFHPGTAMYAAMRQLVMNLLALHEQREKQRDLDSMFPNMPKTAQERLAEVYDMKTGGK